MKNYLKINSYRKIISLIISLLFIGIDLFAQGPPPPPGQGVPLDFGISALIAACIGYGAVKLKKNKGE
ncbi:hypothetical protein N9242_03745 [Vicingaceae bacterium]|jgi:hypothetical protein|nr:hypothetical protein [Vicingaceae bacterium]